METLKLLRNKTARNLVIGTQIITLGIGTVLPLISTSCERNPVSQKDERITRIGTSRLDNFSLHPEASTPFPNGQNLKFFATCDSIKFNPNSIARDSVVFFKLFRDNDPNPIVSLQKSKYSMFSISIDSKNYNFIFLQTGEYLSNPIAIFGVYQDTILASSLPFKANSPDSLAFRDMLNKPDTLKINQRLDFGSFDLLLEDATDSVAVISVINRATGQILTEGYGINALFGVQTSEHELFYFLVKEIYSGFTFNAKRVEIEAYKIQ